MHRAANDPAIAEAYELEAGGLRATGLGPAEVGIDSPCYQCAIASRAADPQLIPWATESTPLT